MAKNPYEAVGVATWLRGMQLGALVLAFFTGGAALAFLFLKLVMGMGLAYSLFFGLIVGPLIGTVGFALLWKVRSGALLAEPPTEEETP